MKTYCITFLGGIFIGAGTLFLILNRTSPAEVSIKQEKGETLKVVSSQMKRGIHQTLTTKLYSKPTGEVTITQTVPPHSAWYLRLGLMPNFGTEFGLSGLVGIEYQKGQLGYFLDTFYDPLHKHGGIILGLSIKIW